MNKIKANNSEYKSIVKTISGNDWMIMIVTGKINHVVVQKLTNNPFGTLGKEFKSFDDAKKHYKSPDMKMNLELAELELTGKI